MWARKYVQPVRPILRPGRLVSYMAAQFSGHEAHYRVEMAYLGVHPALSELGLLNRDHEAKQPGGPGYNILPGLELHNECVTGVVDTLEAAEEQGWAQAQHIVTREGIVFSKERDEHGVWRPETRIRDAMDEARARPWSAETKQYVRERRDELEAARRPEWGDRLEHLDATAAPKLAEGSARTRTAAPDGPEERRRRAAEAATAYSSTVPGPPTAESSSGRQQPGADRPRHAQDSSNSRGPGRQR